MQGWILEPLNLEFSSSECDPDLTMATMIGTIPIDAQKRELEKYNEIEGSKIEPIIPGLQEYEWLDENTLYAEAIILVNCGTLIRYGDYKIHEDKLILEYHAMTPVPLQCRCAHRLHYKIRNLDSKEYVVSFSS